MSRTLTSTFQAALTGDILYPIFFFEAEFASATLRLWTGFGDRSWNGHTWSGVGWLIGMSEVEETTETKASSMTLGLTATTEVVSVALQEFRRNRPITIWLGLLSDAVVLGDPSIPAVPGDPVLDLALGTEKGALVADPMVWFSGLADLALVDVEPDKPGIQIRYKSRLADLERARVRRMTPEDQAIEYAGDKFFAYVGPLSDAVLNWGG